MNLTSTILVVAALCTRLLMMILAFFQRAPKDLSASELTVVMQVLLGVVRAHPLNYGLVTASMLALVALRASAGEPAFLFVPAGLLAFVAGPVLVSRFFAEPIYDVFLSWRSISPPEDWREARDRYFRINAVRGLGSGAAFVLLLVGLVSL